MDCVRALRLVLELTQDHGFDVHDTLTMAEWLRGRPEEVNLHAESAGLRAAMGLDDEDEVAEGSLLRQVKWLTGERERLLKELDETNKAADTIEHLDNRLNEDDAPCVCGHALDDHEVPDGHTDGPPNPLACRSCSCRDHEDAPATRVPTYDKDELAKAADTIEHLTTRLNEAQELNSQRLARINSLSNERDSLIEKAAKYRRILRDSVPAGRLTLLGVTED